MSLGYYEHGEPSVEASAVRFLERMSAKRLRIAATVPLLAAPPAPVERKAPARIWHKPITMPLVEKMIELRASGKRCKEIGAELGVSEVSVSHWISRAKRGLLPKRGAAK